MILWFPKPASHQLPRSRLDALLCNFTATASGNFLDESQSIGSLGALGKCRVSTTSRINARWGMPPVKHSHANCGVRPVLCSKLHLTIQNARAIVEREMHCLGSTLLLLRTIAYSASFQRVYARECHLEKRRIFAKRCDRPILLPSP